MQYISLCFASSNFSRNPFPVAAWTNKEGTKGMIYYLQK